MFCGFFLRITDKPGKGGDGKNAKKASVSKPNSIKSMFMNSNVKKPAEVSDHTMELILFSLYTYGYYICMGISVINVYYVIVWVAEKCGHLQ